MRRRQHTKGISSACATAAATRRFPRLPPLLDRLFLPWPSLPVASGSVVHHVHSQLHQHELHGDEVSQWSTVAHSRSILTSNYVRLGLGRTVQTLAQRLRFLTLAIYHAQLSPPPSHGHLSADKGVVQRDTFNSVCVQPNQSIRPSLLAQFIDLRQHRLSIHFMFRFQTPSRVSPRCHCHCP